MRLNRIIKYVIVQLCMMQLKGKQKNDGYLFIQWLDINQYIENNRLENNHLENNDLQNDDSLKFDGPCDDHSQEILPDDWPEIEEYMQNLADTGSNPSSLNENEHLHYYDGS